MEKLHYTAKEVAEMLDVSVSHLWGFFFCRDTYMIPVLIVPQILMSTKQKCHRYFLLSHFFLFSKIIPII